MTLALRPYQSSAHAAVFDAMMEEYKSLLITSATGTGKTVTISAIIKTFLEEYSWKVLFLAERMELVDQAYLKIRDYCELMEEYGIDKEMGALHFTPHCDVVVGSRQTCCKENRLEGWVPDVVVIDECHSAQSQSYKDILARFDPKITIGLTAVAERGDRLPVFHENLDGSKTRLRDGNTERDTKKEECSFEKHVYDYPLSEAVRDGYLVEPYVHTVKGGVDLSKVPVEDGEYTQNKLNAELEKTPKRMVDRINKAIAMWKKVASDQPTVVFCPTVKYAHWAKALWQQAGYTAQCIDSTTDKVTRSDALMQVHKGNVQVTCNYGIYTHGTDVDKWSCVVLLRPTGIASLMMQMIGRGTRPIGTIANALGVLGSPEERRDLIARSTKPKCIVIDVVDIVGKHKISTVSSTLGLPPKFDMQGHSISDAQKIVKEFDSKKKSFDFECPATYEEVQVVLEASSILDLADPQVRPNWMINDKGEYTFGKARPGYGAKLYKTPDGWKLVVHHKGEVLYDKIGSQSKTLGDHFTNASRMAFKIIGDHATANPPLHTEVLKSADLWHLRKRYRDNQINAMSMDSIKEYLSLARAEYFRNKRSEDRSKERVF